MPRVKVRNNNVNSALRVLKRKCIDHLWEVKERKFYTKPSAAKRKGKKAGSARSKKRERDETTRNKF